MEIYHKCEYPGCERRAMFELYWDAYEGYGEKITYVEELEGSDIVLSCLGRGHLVKLVRNHEGMWGVDFIRYLGKGGEEFIKDSRIDDINKLAGKQKYVPPMPD